MQLAIVNRIRSFVGIGDHGFGWHLVLVLTLALVDITPQRPVLIALIDPGCLVAVRLALDVREPPVIIISSALWWKDRRTVLTRESRPGRSLLRGFVASVDPTQQGMDDGECERLRVKSFS